MGVVYYIARDDNRTLFELGKYAYAFRDEAERAGGLTSAGIWKAAGEAVEDATPEWRTMLVERILWWAEGQPVRFFSDTSYEWEAVRYDTDSPYVITGTAYSEDPFPYTGDADYLRERAEDFEERVSVTTDENVPGRLNITVRLGPKEN